MEKSAALSLFAGWKGMPALYYGTDEKTLAEIREFGYTGVDLFVDDPFLPENRAALGKLRKHGLGVGAVMPALLAKQGLSLGDKDPEMRKYAVERIGDMIRFASEASGMVSLGLVRGRAGAGAGREEFFKRLAGSFEELLKISLLLEVPLILEPINRYESDHLNSSMEALDFIKKSGLPLYLMLDTFHMNIEDVDLAECFRRCAPYTKHIHFVDSNRLAPGMGHLNMAELYRTLEKLDYSGYLCLEALPLPSGSECARMGAKFFGSQESSSCKTNKLFVPSGSV